VLGVKSHPSLGSFVSFVFTNPMAGLWGFNILADALAKNFEFPEAID
jgi:hypothetical protein